MSTHVLRTADRIFRIAGLVTLAGLAATIALAISGAAIWRPVFSLTHLAALVALLPLGIALVVHAYREAGGLGAMISRHALVAAALAVIAVTVTVSLMEFDGNRDVRRIANFTTVGLVALLLARYLRWFPRNIGRAPAGSEAR